MENELNELEAEIAKWANTKFGPNDATPNAEIVADAFSISPMRAGKVLASLRRQGLIPQSNRLERLHEKKQSDRHTEMFSYIQNYIRKHGWAPSQREIAEHISGSLHTVNCDLRKLEQQGLIEVGPFPRQIRITSSVMRAAEVTM